MFGYESFAHKSPINVNEVPPGALISFVQKGLQYLELEANLNNVRPGPFEVLLATCHFCVVSSAFGRTLVKFTVIQAVLCRALGKVPAHLVVNCATQLTKAACLNNSQLIVDKAMFC